MNEHPNLVSISERADRLEEEKIHEMDRIITRSTLAHLMDGYVKMDTSVEMRAESALFMGVLRPRALSMKDASER